MAKAPVFSKETQESVKAALQGGKTPKEIQASLQGKGPVPSTATIIQWKQKWGLTKSRTTRVTPVSGISAGLANALESYFTAIRKLVDVAFQQGTKASDTLDQIRALLPPIVSEDIFDLPPDEQEALLDSTMEPTPNVRQKPGKKVGKRTTRKGKSPVKK